MRPALVLVVLACAAPPRADVAVPQAAAATGCSRGDRYRVELDEDEVATDAADPRKRQKFPAKDVTAVLVTAAAPLAIDVMIDKRVPDPDHATGTSCAAPGASAGIACTIAARRLTALVDLEAGLVARVPLDLIGAAPVEVHATADAELDHDRTDFAITADGMRGGRAIHLKGHATADRPRTRLVAHVEGTDGDRSLEVFVDVGPAD